jgi:hypothetical protein
MKWIGIFMIFVLSVGLVSPTAFGQDEPTGPSPWDYYWLESAGGAGLAMVGGLVMSIFITDICPGPNACDYATNLLMFTIGAAYFIEPGLGAALIGSFNKVRGNWLLSMLFGSAGLGFGSAMDFQLFENSGLRFPIFGPIFGGLAAALGYNLGAEIIEPAS